MPKYQGVMDNTEFGKICLENKSPLTDFPLSPDNLQGSCRVLFPVYLNSQLCGSPAFNRSMSDAASRPGCLTSDTSRSGCLTSDTSRSGCLTTDTSRSGCLT